MKAYIIPVENYCNARCFFCITTFKKETEFGKLLNPNKIGKIDKLKEIEMLEITGGGEPLIHPRINEILEICLVRKPTVVYTNAKLLDRLTKENLTGIEKLTISRHHYDSGVNQKIMGISYGEDLIRDAVRAGARIRLTAVLCKRGMKTAADVTNYLDWAKSLGVAMVQIRQFFDYEYGEALRGEMVRTEPVLAEILQMKPDLILSRGKYAGFDYEGMAVEFEGDKCACEIGGPNLRGNGNLYYGWTNQRLATSYYHK